jgi:hypothetical protein
MLSGFTSWELKESRCGLDYEAVKSAGLTEPIHPLFSNSIGQKEVQFLSEANMLGFIRSAASRIAFPHQSFPHLQEIAQRHNVK